MADHMDDRGKYQGDILSRSRFKRPMRKLPPYSSWGVKSVSEELEKAADYLASVFAEEREELKKELKSRKIDKRK